VAPTRRPPLLSLRLLIWRCRHALVLAGVVTAVGLVVQAVAPSSPRTVAVVVAARPVERGAVLAAADLTVRHVPPDLVVAGSPVDPATLVGRATASAIPEGLPVVDVLLAGTRFAADPPAGTVVVAVTLGAGTADTLLRAGDTVDLIAPAALPGDAGVDPASAAENESGAAPRTLARHALVVQVGSGEPATGSLLGNADAGSPAASTLVAVSPEEGRVLAAAAGWGPLGAVLVG
jgi:Flp pilus assembly protein CpaB